MVYSRQQIIQCCGDLLCAAKSATYREITIGAARSNLESRGIKETVADGHAKSKVEKRAWKVRCCWASAGAFARLLDLEPVPSRKVQSSGTLHRQGSLQHDESKTNYTSIRREVRV